MAAAPTRPCTARVSGGAGRRRLAKSVIATEAVNVSAGFGAGSVAGPRDVASEPAEPLNAPLTPETGSHSLPLNDVRVPTAQYVTTGDVAWRITTLDSVTSVASKWSTSAIPLSRFCGAPCRASDPGEVFEGGGGVTWNTESRMPERPAPAAITTAATTAQLATAPHADRDQRRLAAAPAPAPASAACGASEVTRSARATKTQTPRK